MLGLTACGSDKNDDKITTPVAKPSFAAGSRMADLAAAGKLTVGTKFDQPLFGLKGLSGKPEGFDVEIAKIIAAKLGIAEDKITFVESVSANREPFLQQKKVDMVVATYTINDKRDKVVDFAGPYFVAGQDILVAKGNPKQITGPESLKGKKTCSVSGSTPAATVQEKYGLSTSELLLVDAYSKCRDALANGQVDAVTTDNVILSGYVSEAAGQVRAGRQAVLLRALRHRHPRGPGAVLRLDQPDAQGRGRRRQLREGLQGHRRQGDPGDHAHAARAARLRQLAGTALSEKAVPR